MQPQVKRLERFKPEKYVYARTVQKEFPSHGLHYPVLILYMRYVRLDMDPGSSAIPQTMWSVGRRLICPPFVKHCFYIRAKPTNIAVEAALFMRYSVHVVRTRVNFGYIGGRRQPGSLPFARRGRVEVNRAVLRDHACPIVDGSGPDMLVQSPVIVV